MENGGALHLHDNIGNPPTNVTITRTAFADNHADFSGYNTIQVNREGHPTVAVPCPTPGTTCTPTWCTGGGTGCAPDDSKRCCFSDVDYESLTVTLPNN